MPHTHSTPVLSVFQARSAKSKGWGLCWFFLSGCLITLTLGSVVLWVVGLVLGSDLDVEEACPGSMLWLWMLLTGLSPIMICCANDCIVMPVVMCLSPSARRGRARSKCQRLFYALFMAGYTVPLLMWGYAELQGQCTVDEFGGTLVYYVAFGEWFLMIACTLGLLVFQVVACSQDNKKLEGLLGVYSEFGVVEVKRWEEESRAGHGAVSINGNPSQVSEQKQQHEEEQVPFIGV
jgi:hypothetical protein